MPGMCQEVKVNWCQLYHMKMFFFDSAVSSLWDLGNLDILDKTLSMMNFLKIVHLIKGDIL